MRVLFTAIILFASTFAMAQNTASNPRILSIYHGLDPLPPRATRLCGLPPAVNQDGMPVVFSVQIDGDSIAPEAFAVTLSTGETVTPLCATLRPALEPLEQRTVLLIGSFSPDDSLPAGVEIVGPLEDADGNSLRGLTSNAVTALEEGPSLVYAEHFAPNTAGLAGECPAQTTQAVLLTWEGGVTGPEGSDLEEPQRMAMSIELEDGSTINPLALADDDPDNHVIACIAESSPASSVSVEAGYFHDPGDDANPATSINVVSKLNSQ